MNSMISENIKRIRIKHRKTSIAVADKLDIPVGRYIAIENGESLISAALISKLAAFYQCSVESIKGNN